MKKESIIETRMIESVRLMSLYVSLDVPTKDVDTKLLETMPMLDITEEEFNFVHNYDKNDVPSIVNLSDGNWYFNRNAVIIIDRDYVYAKSISKNVYEFPFAYTGIPIQSKENIINTKHKILNSITSSCKGTGMTFSQFTNTEVTDCYKETRSFPVKIKVFANADEFDTVMVSGTYTTYWIAFYRDLRRIDHVDYTKYNYNFYRIGDIISNGKIMYNMDDSIKKILQTYLVKRKLEDTLHAMSIDDFYETYLK